MELEHLRYVVKLAGCLNFSRAAAELGITQPSLSQRILYLEHEFGVRLFERKTRSVCLTESGEEFVAHAEQVLAAYDRLQEVMRRQSTTKKGHLRVGTLMNMARLVLNAHVLAFQNEHPHIHLTISEIVGSFELVRQLENDTFDVGFLIPSAEIKLSAKIATHPVLEGRVVAVMPQGHRLAGRAVIALRELSAENLIFPARVHSLFGTVMAACRSSGFDPKIVAQTSQSGTAFELTAKGVGIALLSSQFARAHCPEGIVTIPVDPVIPRSITLAYSQQTANLSAVQVFRDFILKAADTARE